LNFARVVNKLRKEYPYTIVTPKGYLEDIAGGQGCTSASIIIDADGGLFYPCRSLMRKSINLAWDSLTEYLDSYHAQMERRAMRSCNLRCGWYQYFSVASFGAPFSHPLRFASAVKPYLPNVIGFYKNQLPKE
jgi:hypothetical protein